jgi:hypothetical protein
MIAEPDIEKMKHAFSAHAREQLGSLIEAREFRDVIEDELYVLGPGVVAKLADAGIRFRSAGARTRIDELSPAAKKLGIEKSPGDLGLFIPFDRAVYIIEPIPGVSGHEGLHALDYALSVDPFNGMSPDDVIDALSKSSQICEGVRPFATMQDASLAAMLRGNGELPTTYAGVSTQELWAEAGRSYCNVGRTNSLFSEVSAAKYRAVNRRSYALMLSVFHTLNGRAFERLRYA